MQINSNKEISYFGYKLRRETQRIINQLNGILSSSKEKKIRSYHDSNYWNILNFHENQNHKITKKIAIYLIYQPKNIAESTYHTIQHLANNGYSTLIVANHEIKPENIEKLLQNAWKLIERPNFGYDFGGYRDGIRYINELKIKVTHLVIINDSIWFPLYENDEMLTTMEDAEEDFIGVLEHQRKSRNFFSKSKPQEAPFYGSYFWMLKEKAINNLAFTNFWNKYNNTNSKYHTIRNGERKFTHAMKNGGVKNKALFKMDDLINWLNLLPNHEFKEKLKYITSHDPKLQTRLRQIENKYTNTKEWRLSASTIIQEIANRKNVLATAPTLTVENFKVGYFKKGSDGSGIHSINFFIDCVNDNKINKPVDSVWREMLERSKLKY